MLSSSRSERSGKNGVVCTNMDCGYMTGIAEPKLLKHCNERESNFCDLNNCILKQCFRVIIRSFNSICGIVLIATKIIAKEKLQL